MKIRAAVLNVLLGFAASSLCAIDIDSTWLAANGPAPYYLNRANETYRLTTDVVTTGTAFAIIANNVTLNLNGHRVTYNNAARITIPNHSFENGATGWNFSAAPHAVVFPGVWLDNEIYDGSYSLKFGNTTTNQYVTSTTPITLKANTTYSLSAMFEYGGLGDHDNPGVKGYVRLVGTGGEATREAFLAGTNWRGIQHMEGVFTTGATAETYHVRVGIEGHASGVKPFYIDDIKIQKTKNFGIVVSPKGWSPGTTPDVTSYGEGTNATITNGAIVQGQEGATGGHGVFIYATQGVALENLDVTVHGANSSAFAGQDMYTYPTTINGNTLTSNVRTITARDHFNGAVIDRLLGTITNNTITNGPHGGIIAIGPPTGGVASVIAGNTVQLKAKYSNAWAILGSRSSQIHDNQILSGKGDYTSHGIGIPTGSEASPARVYNNTIEVQQLPYVNQEYGNNGGIPIGGAFGMQYDNSAGTGSAGEHFTEIYNNRITLIGTTATQGIRVTEATTGLLHIYNNTITAVSGGYTIPFAFFYTEPENVLIEDNTIITDAGIAGAIAGSMGMVMSRTYLQVVDPPQADPYTFTSYYFPPDPPGVHSSVILRDTIFTDAESRTFLENAVVREEPRALGGLNHRIEIIVDWTTTVLVNDSNNQPMVGATVSIKDKDNVEVYADTTDIDGQVSAVLMEQQRLGGTKTEYGPYEITVTFGGLTTTQSLTADRAQTVTIVLDLVSGTPSPISGLQVTQIFANSAVITWTTNEPADSLIEYRIIGTTPWKTSLLNSQLVTEHAITLSGLKIGTAYLVRAKSKDASGNSATSGIITFSTLPGSGGQPPGTPPPPDGNPPPAANGELFMNVLNLTKANALLIPCQHNVKIVSRVGELMRELNCNGATADWDGKSQNGAYVSAGVYIAMERNQPNRKLAVIK